jgi:RNA polymerase sigma factor (sigma-70 family)
LIEVSRRIQTFEYDRKKGTFKAWLYKLARWRLSNYLKKRHRSVETYAISFVDELESLHKPTGGASNEDIWEEEWQNALIKAALGRLRQQLSSKHFQILDCLTVKQWSICEISKIFHLSQAHLYVIKYRVLQALKNEVRRLERQRF